LRSKAAWPSLDALVPMLDSKQQPAWSIVFSLAVLFLPCLPASAQTSGDGITLTARPAPAAADATLEWTGSQPTFEVFRSTSPDTIDEPIHKLGETNRRAFTDPVAPAPGGVFFYAVAGGIDPNRPTITATVSPPPNVHGWNNSDTTVSFICFPSLDFICSPPVILSTEGGNQEVTGTAIGVDGTTATVTAVVKIDKSPPFITSTVEPEPGPNGWHITDVQVTFLAADTLSGLLSQTPPIAFTAEGRDQSAVGTATDLAGNSASVELLISIDRTPPMLEITAPGVSEVVEDPAPVIALAYADTVSGVAAADLNVAVDGVPVSACQVGPSTSSCDPGPLPSGTRNVSAEVSDLAGNRATASSSFQQVSLVPLAIQISQPAEGLLTRESMTQVSGTVSPEADSVTVNEIMAVVEGAVFTARNVPLREGRNALTAIARSPAPGLGMATVVVTRDTEPPRAVLETPVDGQIIFTSTVEVAGLVNDTVTGTVNAENCQVMIRGRFGSSTASVRNRTFWASGIPLVPGPNTLTATAVDSLGNVGSPVEVKVVRQDPAGQRIDVASGNGQSGSIGTDLQSPLVVSLADEAGQPVAGRRVTFSVSRGDGRLVGQSASGRRIDSLTDAGGLAQVNFGLGTRMGQGNHRVRATALGFPGEANFFASALGGAPSGIKPISGEAQTGAVGQPLPLPFVVFAHDEGGNPVQHARVLFQVRSGGGSIEGDTSFASLTNSDGLAQALVVLGPEAGINNNVVDAALEGIAGAPVVLVASGLVPGLPGATRVSGVVLDNTNAPVPHAMARIAGSALQALTDNEGQFAIPGAPVGLIHLVVDGTTTTRPGIWPVLGFDLPAVSGQDNTIGMPVFLLPLDTSRARVVGGPEEVTLSMAEVPGFAVTVLPNSVTCPDGSAQCAAMVTQVHRDKVPMPPPKGAAPRLVLTVQPPGIIFNPPARITSPNVEGLPPGHVSDLISFDHDLGQFISVGTMSVSEDGSVLRSDPGVGIIKAGWHFPNVDPPTPTCAGSQCVDTTPDNCTNIFGNTCPRCQDEPKPDGTPCKTPLGRDGCCKRAFCIPCPKSLEVFFSAPVPLAAGFPTFRSLGGVVAAFKAGPDSMNWDGAVIMEQLSLGLTDCPMPPFKNLIEGNQGPPRFMIGKGADLSPVPVKSGALQNVFYDGNVQFATVDLLGIAGISRCEAVLFQKFICPADPDGKVLGDYKLTFTFTKGSLQDTTTVDVRRDLVD